MPDDREKCNASDDETDVESETKESSATPTKKLPPPNVVGGNRSRIERSLRQLNYVRTEKVIAKPKIAGRRLRFEQVEEEQDEETERPGARGRSGKGRGRR